MYLKSNLDWTRWKNNFDGQEYSQQIHKGNVDLALW